MKLQTKIIIILMMLLSNKIYSQPGYVNPCEMDNIICLRLFDHGKLITKQDKQYSVHTATPERELSWENCPWQMDSVYCFDLKLDKPRPTDPYILSIIKGKDTMQIVIKNIFFDRFYIDSVSFLPGIYEIELPLEPYRFVDGKSYLYQIYKVGMYESWIITPVSWKAIRVDDKKKVKKE